MRFNRRDWLRMVVAGSFVGEFAMRHADCATVPQSSPLEITGLKVTPIALPDPPILAASGCHGPYFLRNIVELRAEGGIVGIGETHGGANVTKVLDQAGKGLVGQNAFGYRKFARAAPGQEHGGIRGHRDWPASTLVAAPRAAGFASWLVDRCVIRSSLRLISSIVMPPIIR